ncbi:MAG: SdiA-regulated domain-containing protein, partial [bacterium]
MDRLDRTGLKIFSACCLMLGCCGSNSSEPEFGEVNLSLTYLDRFDINNETEGLDEPSGLALSREKNALWTVSDKTKKIFKLNLDGGLQTDNAFEIPDEGLEDIALDPTGEFLFMVKEEGNEIIKLNVNTQEVAHRRALSEMAGYDTIARYFVNSPPNKGLEGITWNTDTGSIFVVKEGIPGLLIELSADLATIHHHVLLNEANGFIDNEAVGDKLDFSGICYDRNRKYFWIVSDKGQRLFLYDWQRNKVIQSLPLGYSINGEYR